MTNEFREEKILTEEEVRQAVRYWQNRLRLNDWIIKTGIRRKADFPEHIEAQIHYNLNKKNAFLYVLHPDDAENDQPHDMEALIVHELLHLHFGPLEWEDLEKGYSRDTLEDVAIEQAIESITSALITLERKQGARVNQTTPKIGWTPVKWNSPEIVPLSGKIESVPPDQPTDDRRDEERDKLRRLAEERDTYRERMLILQNQVDELKKDLELISGLRRETTEENLRLQRQVKALQEQLEEADAFDQLDQSDGLSRRTDAIEDALTDLTIHLQELSQKVGDQATDQLRNQLYTVENSVTTLNVEAADIKKKVDYLQGAEDARRRHDRKRRPKMPSAVEGARDVSTHRTKVLGGLGGVADLIRKKEAQRSGFDNLKDDLTEILKGSNWSITGFDDGETTVGSGSDSVCIKVDNQPTDYDDEPTLYEEPDDGTGAD